MMKGQNGTETFPTTYSTYYMGANQSYYNFSSSSVLNFSVLIED